MINFRFKVRMLIAHSLWFVLKNLINDCLHSSLVRSIVALKLKKKSSQTSFFLLLSMTSQLNKESGAIRAAAV